MLTVSGKCLSSNTIRKKGVSSKTGVAYDFEQNRCYIHHPTGGSDPIKVNTGDVKLIPEKFYKIPVRVNAFLTHSGGVAYELLTYQDNPPQEVSPPQANPAK